MQLFAILLRTFRPIFKSIAYACMCKFYVCVHLFVLYQFATLTVTT